MRLLVLKHASNEGLGAWEGVARERAVSRREVEVGEGEPIPPLEDYQAIVSLGGPMGADDPGLAAERELLAQAAREGVAVLGVCLGGQLLAHALGGRIFPNPGGPEIGLSEVELTEAGRADPLFAGLPSPLPVMQWHGDAFGVPEGAALLATAPACENQTFRAGRRAYGVLFHPEVLEREAADWLGREDSREYAREAGAEPDDVLDGVRGLPAAGVRLLRNWLGLV
ncbi:MAG: type 1 glutamine amidotransferase [Gaiellaceae bacterium]